jgi:Cu2+-exporting ATPase
MTCCADPRATLSGGIADLPGDLAAGLLTEGRRTTLTLHVPGIDCAACIGPIEAALSAGGASARANLTRRTVTVAWDGEADPAGAVARLRDLGFAPTPVPASVRAGDAKGAELVRCLAVAGFGAMNVMLLSVSVWSGADGSTRAFLNWLAALIALPALAYAARPFVRSALASLARGRLNMDVPISLAILLASSMSLAKTIAGSGEVFFDAAITLTFFLLAGRLLDHLTRERARASVSRLAAITPAVAHVADGDGTRPIAVADVEPGATVEVAAGERVPVDGRLLGAATFDTSLATGESRPLAAAAGSEILAGALALTGPVRLVALRGAADSFLSRLAALQAAAEASRSRPARIADRAARIYSPLVHLVALTTTIGWLLAGASLGEAVTTAISVLIITCPCALGLAVPVVHVAACERLFGRGILIKDGAALERLRSVTEVAFDKTGTLTTPALDPRASLADRTLGAAAALARHSTHPVSRAVLAAADARGLALPAVTDVVERRGEGIAGRIDGRRASLGRDPAGAAGLVFVEDGRTTRLPVVETLRPGAAALVRTLAAEGLPVTILSGDEEASVSRIAAALGVADWSARMSPEAKLAALRARSAAGARVLMVGDGLNDGPALAAAHASVAPADASDLSRTAADLVLTGDRLDDVAFALETARRAHRLTLENFAICGGYNILAVPIAVAGLASPLMAAIAMSTSSILVIGNALRLLRRPAAPREVAMPTGLTPAPAL